MPEYRFPYLAVRIHPPGADDADRLWREGHRTGWRPVTLWGRGGWLVGPFEKTTVLRYDDPVSAVFALATYLTDDGDVTLRAFTLATERDAMIDAVAEKFWRKGVSRGPNDLPPGGGLLPHHRGPFSPAHRHRREGARNDVVVGCATCLQQLTGVHEYDPDEDIRVVWLHKGPGSHTPVPKLLGADEALLGCDFCSANATWRFTATTNLVRMYEIGPRAVHGPVWEACAHCKKAVVARDAARLASRTMRDVREALPNKHEDFYRGLEDHIRGTHEAFFLTRPGEPERIT